MQKSDVQEGREVIYWEKRNPDGSGENPTRTVLVSNKVEGQGDQATCKILEKGKEKIVPLRNVDPITPGAIMAAQLAGMITSPDEFKKESEKYFRERGVIAVFD